MWLLRLLIAALLVTGGLSGGTSVYAQEAKPIYLYTGQENSKDFTWIENPEEATAYVFREPVPDGDSGGRAASTSTVDPFLSSLGQDVFATAKLTTGEHPTYGAPAIRTADGYPSTANRQPVRYFLLIEIEGQYYSTRTIGGGSGNYPRFYTLGEKVGQARVGKVHRSWSEDAERVLTEAKVGLTSRETSQERSKAAENTDRSGETSRSAAPESTTTDKSGAAEQPSSRGGDTSARSERVRIGNWLPWGGGAAFGLIMFAIGMVVGKNRDEDPDDGGDRPRGSVSQNEFPSAPSPSSSGQPSPENNDGPSDTEELWSEIEDAREAIMELHNRIGQLEKKVETQSKKIDELQTLATQPEPTSQPERQSPDPGGPAEDIADAFIDWCQQAGSRVRKIQYFREQIQASIPNADVKEIQYERDSASQEFMAEAKNGSTYWQVTVKGQTFVLPRPLNRKRFGDLDPVYNGRAKPNSLQSIEPARLTKKAGHVVLDRQGSLR